MYLHYVCMYFCDLRVNIVAALAGCSSLALVGGKESVAKQIINKRLVRTLAPLMLDTNISVQHAAVGALRNISLSDPSTCDHMVEQDVFTTLWNLLGQFQALDWQPCQKTTGIDSKTEIFVEAINLLWNLCEANEKVVKKLVERSRRATVWKKESWFTHSTTNCWLCGTTFRVSLTCVFVSH